MTKRKILQAINSLDALRFDSRTVPGGTVILDVDPTVNVTFDPAGSGLVNFLADRNNNGVSFSQATQANMMTYTPQALGRWPSISGTGATRVLLGNSTSRSLFQNRTGVTCYAVVRSSVGSTNYWLSATQNGSNTIRFAVGTASLDTFGDYGIFGSNNDTGGVFTSKGARTAIPQFEMICMSRDWANNLDTMYKNGVQMCSNAPFSGTGQTPNTIGNGVFLFGGPTANYMGADMVRLVFFNGVHTAAQRDYVHARLAQQYGKQFFTTSAKRLIQLHGDSITAGSALTASPNDYDKLAWNTWVALGADPNIHVQALGWPGATAVQISGERGTLVDVQASGSFTRTYVSFMGTNSVLGSETGANTYLDIKTGFQGFQTAHADGKVVVCTPIARADASFTTTMRTQLVALQSAINTNAVTDGANQVCDFGAITQFLTNSATLPTNTTYYVDKVHPTPLGNTILGPALATAILAAG